MRLLYVTFMLQHPRLRGPNRHYHFLRELAREHRITLLSLTDQAMPPELRSEIEGFTERLMTWPVPGGRWSATAGTAAPGATGRRARWRGYRSAVRSMRQAFDAAVTAGAYDAVLLHGKNLLDVVSGRGRTPLVLEFCDAGSLRIRMRMGHVRPAKRLLLAAQYLIVRRMERQAVRATPHLSFITRRDRSAILGPASRAPVIPNGIDLAYWRRSPELASRPHRLVLTGVMSYAPNADAALQLVDAILPRIRAALPEVELCIVGRDPPAALLARAECDPALTVTGFVDDLRPFLASAALFAAPLRFASGMQNKVQEAMAMGVPVVTTPVVSEGLWVRDDDPPPLEVADGAEAFAARVMELLGDADRRSALAAAGRRYAERYWVWPERAAQLAALCETAVRQTVRGAAAGATPVPGRAEGWRDA